MTLVKDRGWIFGKIAAGTPTYIQNAGFAWLLSLVPLSELCWFGMSASTLMAMKLMAFGTMKDNIARQFEIFRNKHTGARRGGDGAASTGLRDGAAPVPAPAGRRGRGGRRGTRCGRHAARAVA